jgi:hypothetical protein
VGRERRSALGIPRHPSALRHRRIRPAAPPRRRHERPRSGSPRPGEIRLATFDAPVLVVLHH